MLNHCILMGRLTRDPELKHTQNGTAVTSFTVAVNRPYSNERERQADFIDVVAWRHNAEFVCRWFRKGMMIIVIGSIQTSRWEDKDGNKRTTVQVVAHDARFGETKKSRETHGGYQGGYSAPPYVDSGFDMPQDGADFSEITDDDGEVPF